MRLAIVWSLLSLARAEAPVLGQVFEAIIAAPQCVRLFQENLTPTFRGDADLECGDAKEVCDRSSACLVFSDESGLIGFCEPIPAECLLLLDRAEAGRAKRRDGPALDSLPPGIPRIPFPGSSLLLTEQCCEWARHGQCDANPNWMKTSCATACGTIGCSAYSQRNLCTTRIHRDCFGDSIRDPLAQLASTTEAPTTAAPSLTTFAASASLQREAVPPVPIVAVAPSSVPAFAPPSAVPPAAQPPGDFGGQAPSIRQPPASPSLNAPAPHTDYHHNSPEHKLNKYTRMLKTLYEQIDDLMGRLGTKLQAPPRIKFPTPAPRSRFQPYPKTYYGPSYGHGGGSLPPSPVPVWRPAATHSGALPPSPVVVAGGGDGYASGQSPLPAPPPPHLPPGSGHVGPYEPAPPPPPPPPPPNSDLLSQIFLLLVPSLPGLPALPSVSTTTGGRPAIGIQPPAAHKASDVVQGEVERRQVTSALEGILARLRSAQGSLTNLTEGRTEQVPEGPSPPPRIPMAPSLVGKPFHTKDSDEEYIDENVSKELLEILGRSSSQASAEDYAVEEFDGDGDDGSVFYPLDELEPLDSSLAQHSRKAKALAARTKTAKTSTRSSSPLLELIVERLSAEEKGLVRDILSRSSPQSRERRISETSSESASAEVFTFHGVRQPTARRLF